MCRSNRERECSRRRRRPAKIGSPQSASVTVKSRRRKVDEAKQAEPAATPADGGGARWKPSGRSEGAGPRNRSSDTWRAAGPLRRAVALREGGPLAARVEDA